MSANAVAACRAGRYAARRLHPPALDARARRPVDRGRDRWRTRPRRWGPSRERRSSPRGGCNSPLSRACAQHRYIVRAIDRPAEIDALPFCKLIFARGPFSFADELELMKRERIDALVTKNSGGRATYAKIEAARALGIEVVMVRRPPAPEAPDCFLARRGDGVDPRASLEARRVRPPPPCFAWSPSPPLRGMGGFPSGAVAYPPLRSGGGGPAEGRWRGGALIARPVGARRHHPDPCAVAGDEARFARADHDESRHVGEARVRFAERRQGQRLVGASDRAGEGDRRRLRFQAPQEVERLRDASRPRPRRRVIERDDEIALARRARAGARRSPTA